MESIHSRVFSSVILWLTLLCFIIGVSIAMMIFCPRPQLILIISAALSFLGILMGIRAVLRLGITKWIESLYVANCGSLLEKPGPNATQQEREKYEEQIREEYEHEQTIIDYKFHILGVTYIAFGAILSAVSQLLSLRS